MEWLRIARLDNVYIFWYVHYMCCYNSKNKLENRICKQIQDLHASFWCKRVEGLLKSLKIGSHFQDTAWLSKLPYWGIKLRFCLKRFTEVAYGPSFYPGGGSKLGLFSLYGQRFPRYRPILKITIFGHETWNLKKRPEVAYGPSFYPRGSKLSLFSLYGQRFPRYGPILKITIIGHETWNLK